MKRRFIGALTAIVLAFGIFYVPSVFGVGTAFAAQASETLAVPVSSVKTGRITSDGKYSVALECAASGAKIFYSTCGDYKQYTEPFEITKSATVKCYSQKGGKNSKTVSLKYTLQPKVTLSSPGGRYYKAQTVKVSSPVSGVTFYYTTDGSVPTKSSKKYTGGIKLSESGTLRVLAVKSGWSNRIVNADYTIAGRDESLLDDFKGKYLYSTMTYPEKQVYERLFNGFKNLEAEIDLSGLDYESVDIRKVSGAIKYENPQFFWLPNGGVSDAGGKVYAASYNGTFDGLTKSEIGKLQKKIEAAAEKIVQKALKKTDTTERLRVIHDEIIKMTDYEISWERYNGEPDGPLLYGKARCEGYAKAFCYVAQMAGVEAVSVSGFAAQGSHLWNMVKVGGKWLHIDTTFDENFGYEYFCIDDAYCSLDHVPNTDLPYPSKIKFDEKKVKAEFDKFMEEIKENYDKGIGKTRHYVDKSIMGGFLKYAVYHMNQGVYDMGIKKQPWYSYYGNWMQIELK